MLLCSYECDYRADSVCVSCVVAPVCASHVQLLLQNLVHLVEGPSEFFKNHQASIAQKSLLGDSKETHCTGGEVGAQTKATPMRTLCSRRWRLGF